jgi:hypothetical protein
MIGQNSMMKMEYKNFCTFFNCIVLSILFFTVPFQFLHCSDENVQIIYGSDQKQINSVKKEIVRYYEKKGDEQNNIPVIETRFVPDSVQLNTKISFETPEEEEDGKYLCQIKRGNVDTCTLNLTNGQGKENIIKIFIDSHSFVQKLFVLNPFNLEVSGNVENIYINSTGEEAQGCYLKILNNKDFKFLEVQDRLNIKELVFQNTSIQNYPWPLENIQKPEQMVSDFFLASSVLQRILDQKLEQPKASEWFNFLMKVIISIQEPGSDITFLMNNVFFQLGDSNLKDYNEKIRCFIDQRNQFIEQLMQSGNRELIDTIIVFMKECDANEKFNPFLFKRDQITGVNRGISPEVVVQLGKELYNELWNLKWIALPVPISYQEIEKLVQKDRTENDFPDNNKPEIRKTIAEQNTPETQRQNKLYFLVGGVSVVSVLLLLFYARYKTRKSSRILTATMH